MGKVEKVIVLSVLFLIALILVVSLTVDDPLDKSRVVEAGDTPNGHHVSPTPPQNAGEKPAGELARADGTKPGTDASGLLSLSVAPGRAPAPVDPSSGIASSGNDGAGAPGAVPPMPAATNGLPAGALLKSLDGLQDSILTDMKLYTWKEGDSYRLIANKYYGDWNKYTVLRRSNEGRNDVKPGDQVFVPVFDSDPIVAAPIVAGAPSTTPPPPAVPVKGAKTASAADHGSKKSTSKAVPSGKKVHVVKNGESLWKIAHQELGDGGRWKEIYALNKDVLPSESSVHVGQTLRIP